MTFFKKLQAAVWVCILISISSSCVNSKKTIYFADRKDESLASTTTIPQSRIANSDLLSITVTSLNPEASAVYNAPNTTITANSAQQNTGTSIQTTGYLVKSDGTFSFPIVGSVKAAGFTIDELSDQLVKILVNKKLLIDPIVTVRYLNFRVTVLGDITIYGKKDNVLLIREEPGQRLIQQLNLNSKDFFQSPYYYLKSNDVIYVEPSKAKIAAATRTSQFLPVLLSGLSFAAIIIDRLTR